MKRKQIATATILTLTATPAAILSAYSISSCSLQRGPSEETKGIDVSTKDVEINHNSGVGTFDVFLDEQPIDNAAYIFINTAEGPHHVELLDSDDYVYHGHPAVLYEVHDGKASVRICFTEFVGETTKTVVSIYVKYNSRNGDWVTKRVDNINLTVSYVHNPIEEVHIICLNDLHGAAEGYGESRDEFPATNIKNPGVIRLMNQISPIIDSHPGSFLVTAGDNNSGDMFSSSVHGESIYKVLKSMGARYSAVGNHAFEWGITPMATYQFDKWARTKDTMGNYFISSNILNGKLDQKKKWVSDPEKDGFEEDFAFWQSQKVGWADPYKLINMNGHIVCLIGLTTQGALEDGNKSVVDNLSFIDYNAAVNYSIYLCKQEIQKQLFDSIESFVLLTHVESDMKDGEAIGPAAELAKNVENEKIDAVISAHSHKPVNASVYNLNFGKNVLIGQAETEGRRYLDLTFRFDNTKPMGQKKISVSQEVKDMTLTFGEGEEGYQKAARDLDKQKNNPTTPTVKNVISSFNYEKNKVLDKLKDVIAERNGSLLYPASKVSGGIGHVYYINQKDEQGKAPEELGGYIIDQLGAWVNYACIGGFADYNRDEIEASSAGLNYPAISLINQDSMRVQFDEPKTPKDHNVTLKDMFSIQTYENTTIFGYLSIWQLANIINHSLAGDGIFNYSKPGVNYYDALAKEEDIPPLNNLTYFVDEYNEDGSVKHKHENLCKANEFPHVDEYKFLKNCCCLYPCGPVQGYGFRFGVERAASSGKDSAGRTWKLRLVPTKDPSIKEGIPNWPDIYILDPRYKEKEGAEIYSTIQQPKNWLSAEEWYQKYGEMIPVITNDFLYNGANWQTPMEAVYMKHNEALSWRNYPVMKFSQITRDLLVRFCNLSQTKYATLFPFDMPIKGLVDQLVDYSAV